VSAVEQPKSRALMLLLAFPFGIFGIHRFCAGKKRTAALMLVVSLSIVASFLISSYLAESAHAVGDVIRQRQIIALSFACEFPCFAVLALWTIVDIVRVAIGSLKP